MAEMGNERVSELERMMKNLAYAHMQKEMSLNTLSEEMRAFKEEMREDRKSMNKKWGHSPAL